MENLLAFSGRKGKTKLRRRGGGGGWEGKTTDEAQPSLPNVPEEVILQILQRLPLRSLSRFKSVSKTWFSLISYFSAKKRGREMVLVVSYDFLHSIDLENYDGEKLYESEDVTRTRKFRAIYGSCNGLLLMGIGQDLFLWNPLTRYFKKVLRYDRYYSHFVSGLCYDSSTDDYKVVMVVDENNYSRRSRSKKVMVGSFKRKSWTEVEYPSNIIGSLRSGPTVNEHLHWYVSKEKKFNSNSDSDFESDLDFESDPGSEFDSDSDSKEEKSEHSQIVYFNTQMGTFEKVPMPQAKQSDRNVIYGLGVLDGCLCMSRSENPSNGKCNYIEVMVMKEYRVANSWTFMFTVSNLRPFGYTRKGEALALQKPTPCGQVEDIWHISVYNPIDDSTRDIPILTPGPILIYDGDLVVYEESIVKPTDYNWEDEELRGEAKYVEYFLNGSHEIRNMDTCWRRQVKRLGQPARLPEDYG